MVVLSPKRLLYGTTVASYTDQEVILWGTSMQDGSGEVILWGTSGDEVILWGTDATSPDAR